MRSWYRTKGIKMEKIKNLHGTENFKLYFQELNILPQSRFIDEEYNRLTKRSLLREDKEVESENSKEVFLKYCNGGEK